MRWISTAQQARDHAGQRNICAADGHEFTTDDPEVLTTDGWRVHRSDTENPRSGLYGDVQEG
jgi:prepilin-type processing-associated H-X9-DG protein